MSQEGRGINDGYKIISIYMVLSNTTAITGKGTGPVFLQAAAVWIDYPDNSSELTGSRRHRPDIIDHKNKTNECDHYDTNTRHIKYHTRS